ncbi:MAG: amidohydrolase family protein [Chloroflexi bacterium]|nr:amidohydrolase family protein [Chloroflexota bacterium]
MVSFDEIPLIDGHAHPLLFRHVAARERFARFFTEADAPEVVERHAPQTLFYRHALRELAALLGCEPTEEALVAARAALDFEAYLSRLLADARVEAVLLDDGYPRTGALSVTEVAAAGGVPAWRVLRIERLLEDLIPAHDSLASPEAAVMRELEAAAPGLVAIKSVIAYRTGLCIAPPNGHGAERALAEVRAAWNGTPGRLATKPLLDRMLIRAANWAAAHRLPLQLHTGFSDRDLDLRLANPLHLRPLLEGGALGGGLVVLLHAAYPYVREAGYLASIYPNVYVDVSLATPLLAGPGLTRVLEELLALAPITKVVYGSDAWGVPEWFWLAARAARRALSEVLTWLPEWEARWAARRILHDNATGLYRLETFGTQD